MAVVSISIEPREEDRPEAFKRVLAELLYSNGNEDIVQILVWKEMKIIQAERLREKVKNFTRRELVKNESSALR